MKFIIDSKTDTLSFPINSTEEFIMPLRDCDSVEFDHMLGQTILILTKGNRMLEIYENDDGELDITARLCINGDWEYIHPDYDELNFLTHPDHDDEIANAREI